MRRIAVDLLNCSDEKETPGTADRAFLISWADSRVSGGGQELGGDKGRAATG